MIYYVWWSENIKCNWLIHNLWHSPLRKKRSSRPVIQQKSVIQQVCQRGMKTVCKRWRQRCEISQLLKWCRSRRSYRRCSRCKSKWGCVYRGCVYRGCCRSSEGAEHYTKKSVREEGCDRRCGRLIRRGRVNRTRARGRHRIWRSCGRGRSWRRMRWCRRR